MSAPGAVVTGAGSGIGAATARRLAAGGSAVAVVDRDGAAAETVAAELRDGGAIAAAFRCDVADTSAVDATLAAIAAELGPAGTLVASAGVHGGGRIEDLDRESWDRTLAVNLTGVFALARGMVPWFRDLGGGAIVTVASTAALAGIDGAAAYCASKGGVVALTRALAVELAPLGVRANVICPGTVETPFSLPGMAVRGDGDVDRGRAVTGALHPVGRVGEPDDVAALAAFLAGPDAGFVSGATVVVDGGLLARFPLPVPPAGGDSTNEREEST